MDGQLIGRRLRGVIGNAVVWGGIWFVILMLMYTVQRLTGDIPSAESWYGGFAVAARGSVVGGLASALFSTFIAFRYRGRRLAEISWLRFGLGGGVVGGLFIPGMMIIGRLLSGDTGVPHNSLLFNGLVGAVFGSVSAAGSLRLAQLSERFLQRRGRVPDLLDDDGLPIPLLQRRDRTPDLADESDIPIPSPRRREPGA